MKKPILFFLILLAVIPAGYISAQQVQISAEELKRPTDLPMQVRLFNLCLAAQSDADEADRLIARHDFIQRKDGKISVRIIHPKEIRAAPPASVLAKHKIEVYREDPEQTSIYIEPEGLIALAEDLPDGYVLYQELKMLALNEGPTPQVHNSASYSSGDAPGGAGIRIGIIDVGFNGIENAIANGRAPAEYDSTDYSSSGVINGSTHGVAVIETVFDHAPNAEYYIYKVINPTQCAAAIDQAVLDNVDIINMSLGYSGQGWYDDDNTVCTATNAAADEGILIFVSSGNSKKMHWQGNFSDNDGDTWHGWSGNDELNVITLQDTTRLSVFCVWDPSENTDYNVYIYNAQGNQILDSDEMTGTTFESVTFNNISGSAVTVAIAVRKVSGPSVEFEIQCVTTGVGSSVVNDQINYRVAQGSILWPASCSSDNVIGVAAVDRPDFNNPSGTTGISTIYSSEGPTNEGNQGVDITGATVTTIGGGGQFFGTSCSAPNATGATAAFWSSQPNLNADNVRYLIFKKADIYKDWGSPGLDYIYGWGGLYLHDYIPNTKYVDRQVNNPFGLYSRVFQNVDDAFGAIPNPPAEGAVILFGGNYPSPYIPLNYLMNKNVTLETLGGESMLGNN